MNEIGRRSILPTENRRLRILTNFYPRYNSTNDQVDRVSEVIPVYYQRVIPRYRLSTSETRDQGTGPGFIRIPAYSIADETTVASATSEMVVTPAAVQPARSGPGRALSSPPLIEEWKGNNVDIFA